jgi:hypothetical protein
MQEAQGVPALSSNLPQEYAGGGIIAFDEGGEVKRYAGVGPSLTSSVPALSYEQLSRLYATDPKLAKEAALRAGPVGQRILAGIEAAARVGAVPAAVGAGGAAASEFAAGVTGAMSPEQRKAISSNPMLSAMSGDTGIAAAIQNAPNMEKPTMGSGDQIFNALSFFPKTLIGAPGDANSPKGYGLTRLLNSDSAPAAASITGTPYDPSTATRRSAYPEQTPPSTAPAAPVAPTIPGAGDFKMPTLPKMKSIDAPALTKYDTLIGDMPTKTKEAFEDKVSEVQGIYEAFDKPGNEARESRLTKREAAQEKDSAIGRALNLMSLGFGIAGSKERTLAGALGNEGRQGIADLIRGEAANRAAKDRLEDARDNFEQQKVAAKKGNYQAAQQAGQRAADDLRAGTQLTMTGAHYGNTEANQRLQLEQQGEFQRTSLEQQGILALEESKFRQKQLNQNAATANAQLQLGREKLGIIKGQIAAGDKRAQAALANAERQAYAAFQTSPQFQQAQMQAKKMAPIEAQRFMEQEWLKYSANAVPSLFAGQGGGANVPTWAEAMKAME